MIIIHSTYRVSIAEIWMIKAALKVFMPNLTDCTHICPFDVPKLVLSSGTFCHRIWPGLAWDVTCHITSWSNLLVERSYISQAWLILICFWSPKNMCIFYNFSTLRMMHVLVFFFFFRKTNSGLTLPEVSGLFY